MQSPVDASVQHASPAVQTVRSGTQHHAADDWPDVALLATYSGYDEDDTTVLHDRYDQDVWSLMGGSFQ